MAARPGRDEATYQATWNSVWPTTAHMANHKWYHDPRASPRPGSGVCMYAETRYTILTLQGYLQVRQSRNLGEGQGCQCWVVEDVAVGGITEQNTDRCRVN